jgi:hypothetical protein
MALDEKYPVIPRCDDKSDSLNGSSRELLGDGRR